MATSKSPKPKLITALIVFNTICKKNQIDVALIIQKADLFYFAGTIQDAHLIIPAEGEPLLAVHKNRERAKAESPHTNVQPLTGLKQLPQLVESCLRAPPRRMGLELDVLPVKHYFAFKTLFDIIDWVDVSPEIRQIRAVKSPFEIDIMSAAALLSDRLAAGLPDLLQVGMSEIELAGEVESLARKMGHQGIVRMRLWGHELFYGHLMAGPAAAMGSYLASPTGGSGVGPAVAQGAGHRTIQPHEPILLDYVFVHQGYISDHTRILSIGELPDDLMQGHEAMQQIQATVKEAATPGSVAGDLYDLAVKAAESLGWGDHFMGADDQRVRFIGHGVGIELDEYPFLAKGQRSILAEGMTVALEPKLIFPDVGVVGVENTHVVEVDGLRQLGKYSDAITIIAPC